MLQRLFYSFVPALVDLVGCSSDWWSGGHGLDPGQIQQHSFVEIDHEIFSTVILSFPLIRKGQVSVFWQKNVHMYWLTSYRTKPAQEKSVVR